MKSILTLFCISIFILNFSQSPKEETNKLGKNPVFFIDSVRVGGEELQNYDPQEIASLTMYKDGDALKLFPNEGKDGVVYIFTKKFSKKRFQTYFKTKSNEYKKLLSTQNDDSNLQYILNDKILTSDFEGNIVAIIDDKVFKSLKIINKKELQKQFNIEDKDYGILITSEVPDNLHNEAENSNK